MMQNSENFDTSNFTNYSEQYSQNYVNYIIPNQYNNSSFINYKCRLSWDQNPNINKSCYFLTEKNNSYNRINNDSSVCNPIKYYKEYEYPPNPLNNFGVNYLKCSLPNNSTRIINNQSYSNLKNIEMNTDFNNSYSYQNFDMKKNNSKISMRRTIQSNNINDIEFNNTELFRNESNQAIVKHQSHNMLNLANSKSINLNNDYFNNNSILQTYQNIEKNIIYNKLNQASYNNSTAKPIIRRIIQRNSHNNSYIIKRNNITSINIKSNSNILNKNEKINTNNIIKNNYIQKDINDLNKEKNNKINEKIRISNIKVLTTNNNSKLVNNSNKSEKFNFIKKISLDNISNIKNNCHNHSFYEIKSFSNEFHNNQKNIPNISNNALNKVPQKKIKVNVKCNNDNKIISKNIPIIFSYQRKEIKNEKDLNKTQINNMKENINNNISNIYNSNNHNISQKLLNKEKNNLLEEDIKDINKNNNIKEENKENNFKEKQKLISIKSKPNVFSILSKSKSKGKIKKIFSKKNIIQLNNINNRAYEEDFKIINNNQKIIFKPQISVRLTLFGNKTQEKKKYFFVNVFYSENIKNTPDFEESDF